MHIKLPSDKCSGMAGRPAQGYEDSHRPLRGAGEIIPTGDRGVSDRSRWSHERDLGGSEQKKDSLERSAGSGRWV